MPGRSQTCARSGIIHADGGDTVLHRNAIGPGIGSEVGVERAIFLHNDYDVLDLVDTGLTGRHWERACAGGHRDRDQQGSDDQAG